MQRVCVASTNPVKLAGVKGAFEKMFPEQEYEFVTAKAPSGVSDQPMGDDETLLGAKNRASNARKMVPDCDFYCGLEGGCTLEENDRMQCFAWIVIQDCDGKQEGVARTGMFYLPPKVVELVKDGLELGHANDKVFKKNGSKQQGGAVGLLTNNTVTRQYYYEQTIVLALIPFFNQDLYPVSLK
eukprot:m.97452 g.97452  ORF g.97452 m.97452 type:complete len:184 (+) comp8986_c0_seq9:132-683(+)